MTIALTKDSIDLGIVVRDADAALAFYRDTLGFVDTGSMPLPGGGGTMYRLLCGSSLIKLVAPAAELPAAAPPGGIQGGYGYRYWTISVSQPRRDHRALRNGRKKGRRLAARDPSRCAHLHRRRPGRQLGRVRRGERLSHHQPWRFVHRSSTPLMASMATSTRTS